jgi:5-methylcytosine-specific restriction endonuclease McrA
MAPQLSQRVRDRARNCCEYCQLPQEAYFRKFPIDHIRPRKHGGTDDESNLALCCAFCNLHKGSNLTGIDPVTGKIEPLFDPRHEAWSDHFEWNGPILVGRTATGRATIAVMNINDPTRVKLRAAL